MAVDDTPAPMQQTGKLIGTISIQTIVGVRWRHPLSEEFTQPLRNVDNRATRPDGSRDE